MDRKTGHSSWLRRALLLLVATIVYNAIEAGLALYAGARANSIALVAFGLDSVIELTAAGVVLWRVWIEAKGQLAARVEETETRVHKLVGLTFIALALYVVVQSAWVLSTGAAPKESTLGLALAAASLLIMPLLAAAKLRAAREIESEALRAEARETLACAYLSFTLLLGLALNAAAGWWWMDPLAALAMTPWLVREGIEAWRGDHD